MFLEKALQGALPPPAWPNSQEGMGTQTSAWWYSGSHPTSPGAAPDPQLLPSPWGGGATPHPPSQDQQRQSSWLLPWQLRRAGSASPGSTAKDLFKSQHQLGFRLTWAMRARGHLPSLSFVSLCAQWSCSPCTASKFQV